MELAKSIAVAELEVEGEYREDKHDALFKDFGEGNLGQEELSHFPDYLVCVSAARLQAAETDRLMEMLSAGLPVKILVQTDDLLEESTIARDGHFALGMRAKQLASMAIGLNDVFVLQSCSSNLFQFRDRIMKGMSYAGPALFSVYSGAADGSRQACRPTWSQPPPWSRAPSRPTPTTRPRARTGPRVSTWTRIRRSRPTGRCRTSPTRTRSTSACARHWLSPSSISSPATRATPATLPGCRARNGTRK